MISTLIIFTIIAILLHYTSVTFGQFISYKSSVINSFSFNAKQTLNSLIGLTSIIFIYSCFTSGFKTINILFIIPLIGTLLVKQLNSISTKSINKLNWKRNFLLSIEFAFTFAIIFILSLFWDYSKSINNDMFLYANIGKNLSENGSENIFHYFNGILDSKYSEGVFPYHYFEFWFLALLKPLFGKFSAIIILKHFVYNYLKTTIIIGVKAIITELTGKNKFYITPVIVVLTLIPYDDFLNLFDAGWSYYTSIWTRPNFLAYLLVLIPFTLLIFKQKHKLALLTLLTLPIVSTVTAPPVFIFSGLYLIYLTWSKKVTLKEFAILLLTLLTLAISILFFYKTFGIEIKSLDLNAEILISKYKQTWKAMIFFIVTLPLGLLTIITPLFLLSRKSKFKKEMNLLLIAAFSISTFGVLIFQLGNFIDNFYQFPYLGYSFVYLLTIITIGYITFSESIALKRVGFSIIIFGFILFFIDVNPPKSLNLIENNISYKESESKLNFTQLLKNKTLVSGRGLLILDRKTVKAIPPKKRDMISNQYANFLYYINSSIELILYTSPSIYFFDEEKGDSKFNKAHTYNDLMPQELYEGDLAILNTVIDKYKVEFLYLTGEENYNSIKLNYPNKRTISLDNSNYIIVL